MPEISCGMIVEIIGPSYRPFHGRRGEVTKIFTTQQPLIEVTFDPPVVIDGVRRVLSISPRVSDVRVVAAAPARRRKARR